MSDLQPVPEGPLRSGYTTGACATACTKAALMALVSQQPLQHVLITLPAGQLVPFELISCVFNGSSATCTVRKDAGDDPDVTHNAIIGATISLSLTPGIHFLQGMGVGTVTLPGLEIGVGEPAINPVPRKMITAACTKLLAAHDLRHLGVDVTIFVENGEEIAKRTLNSRLGILGGISILGTTGIVTPFSASSYIASIRMGVDVALANGCRELVISSGARSENYLKPLYGTLPDYAFIHYGNWIGETLEKISEGPVNKLTMGIMLGKSVKLAEGILDTHSSKGSWNSAFIYDLAAGAGYPETVLNQIMDLNMAGRLTELFSFKPSEPFYQALLRSCYQHCIRLCPDVELSLILMNKEGAIIKFPLEST